MYDFFEDLKESLDIYNNIEKIIEEVEIHQDREREYKFEIDEMELREWRCK